MALLGSIKLFCLLAPYMVPGIHTKLGIAWGTEDLQPFEFSSSEEVCRFFEQPETFASGLEETAIPNGASPSHAQIQHVVAHSTRIDSDIREGPRQSPNLPLVHQIDTPMIDSMNSELFQDALSKSGKVFQGMLTTDGTQSEMLPDTEENMSFSGNSESSFGPEHWDDTLQQICASHLVSGIRKRPFEEIYGADSSEIKRIKDTHWARDETGEVKTVISGSEQHSADLGQPGLGAEYGVNELASENNATRDNICSRNSAPERALAFNSKQPRPGTNQSMLPEAGQADICAPFPNMIPRFHSYSSQGNVRLTENSSQHPTTSNHDTRFIKIDELLNKFQVKQLDGRQQGSEDNVSSKPNRFEHRELFILKKPYFKAFPWIASLKTDTIPQGKMAAFWGTYDLSFIAGFRKTSAVLLEMTEPGYSEAQFNNEVQLSLQNKIYCLFKLIWYINSKIIESFGVSISDPIFDFEQSALKRWIGESFILPELERCIFSPFLVEMKLRERPKMMQLKRIILEALRYEEKYIKVPYAKLNNEKTTITKGRMLLAKACVYIIGSYYKTKNYRKWECIFQNDEKFLEFLAAMKKRIFLGINKSFNDKMNEKLERFYISPWMDDWKIDKTQILELRRSVESMSSRRIMETVDKYVELEQGFSENSARTVRVKGKATAEKVFVLDQNYSYQFAWIGGIQLQSISHESKESFEKMFDSLLSSESKNVSLGNILGSNSDKRFTNKPEMGNNKRIHALKDLARIVWYLNSKILQCFGIGDSDHYSRYEQEYLLKWLLEQSSSFEDFEEFFDSSIHGQKRSQVPHLIMDVLNIHFTNGHEEGNYDNSNLVDLKEWNAWEKFIKAAIYIIGEYYKRKNYTKWIFIFENEENFLNFISIIKRYTDRKDGEVLIKKAAEKFKYHGVIPWENHCINDHKKTPFYREVFKRFLYRNSEQWLENVMKKKQVFQKGGFHSLTGRL